MEMIKTMRGLPNSCSQCGKPIKEGYWYAANEDAAFAGQGICEKDMQRKEAARLEDEERKKAKSEHTEDEGNE